ncbi:unnamed protein product [Sphenostylis stenocarpa]|uniref:Uncharacterized protein n=1 Tax=Sphenostylis stenocarpa TaxID=92480 RepID=A0AA86W4J4_9FABA|nr:unnamed protein product [Sphenostylis stenocarpa]
MAQFTIQKLGDGFACARYYFNVEMPCALGAIQGHPIQFSAPASDCQFILYYVDYD